MNISTPIKIFFCLFLFLGSFIHSSFSQSTLLKDINLTNGDGFSGSSLIATNPTVIFSGLDSIGTNWWKFNLQTKGVSKFLTSNGNTISSTNSPKKFGNKYLIYEVSTKKIWITEDGEQSTTHLVKQLPSTVTSVDISTGVTSNNRFYFTYNSSATGTELAYTDGTETGTVFLDINPGTPSSNPFNLTPFSNGLFFLTTNNISYNLNFYTINNSSNTPTLHNQQTNSSIKSITLCNNGTEILVWVMSWTSPNDFTVYKFNQSGGGIFTTLPWAQYGGFFNLQNSTYFSYNSKTYKYENNSFIEVTNSYPPPYQSIKVFDDENGNRFYYRYDDNSLIKFDGSSYSTIFTSTRTSWYNAGIREVRSIGNNELLIFSYYTQTSGGNIPYKSQLYKLNTLTNESTLLATLTDKVSSFYTIANIRTYLNNANGNILYHNGAYYFIYGEFNSGNQLWKTDKTANGTMKIAQTKDNFEAVSNQNNKYILEKIEVFENKLVIETADSLYNMRITLFDPATNEFHTINSYSPTELRDESKLLIANDMLLFVANTEGYGKEMWYHKNGTNTLVKDINTKLKYLSYSRANNFIPLNNKLYFTATDGVRGRELWVTDGSNSGTKLFKEFSFGDTHFSGFYTFKNQLFIAITTFNFSEIWRIDENHQIRKISDSTFNISTRSENINFIEYNNQLYFTTNNGLWKIYNDSVILVKAYDGFYNYKGSSIVYNNYFYFSASGGFSNHKLYRSDGTGGGTVFMGDYKVLNFTPFKGELYFGTEAGIYKINSQNQIINISVQGELAINYSFDEYGMELSEVIKATDNYLYYYVVDYSSSKGLYSYNGNTSRKLYELVNRKFWWVYNQKLFMRSPFWTMIKTDGISVTRVLYDNDRLYTTKDSSMFFNFKNIAIYDDALNSVTTLTNHSETPVGDNISPHVDYTIKFQTFFEWKDKIFYTPYESALGREIWTYPIPCKNGLINLNSPVSNLQNGINLTFRTDTQIKASNQIIGGSKIDYKASESIELLPGFETKDSSIFKAQISGCSN